MQSIRVVGCFIRYNDTFLIIRRHPNKPEGNTWGVPAGKVDEGEDDISALMREVFEETAYQLDGKKAKYLGEWDFFVSGRLVTFVAFEYHIPEKISVILNPTEHTECSWITAQECFAKQDLIGGFYALLKNIKYV